MRPHGAPWRWALFATLVVVAINAMGGGVYGLSGAPAVPREWLRGTPFASYTIPSLILLVVVGGATLSAAVAVAFARPTAWRWALGAAVILLGWITVQVALIGYQSWLQPAMAVAAMIIGGLALFVRSPSGALASR